MELRSSPLLTLIGTLEDFEQEIEDYGHFWDTLPHPDLSKNHSSNGSSKGGTIFQ